MAGPFPEPVAPMTRKDDPSKPALPLAPPTRKAAAPKPGEPDLRIEEIEDRHVPKDRNIFDK